MKKILTFPLVDTETFIDLPRERQVVLVGHERGTVTLWIEHDPEGPWVLPRVFLLVNTAEPIPEHSVHVGSVSMDPSGHCIRHVYEVQS